jgi:hypothetical protein
MQRHKRVASGRFCWWLELAARQAHDRKFVESSVLSLISGVVVRVEIIETERADCRHLADVLAGFRPVEMECVAGQNDHGAGGKGLQLIGIEAVANPDVEDARNYRVDSIFGVFMRHQLHTSGYFYSDRVGAGLRRFTDDDCKANRGRKCGERFPIDVFREDGSKFGLSGLVRAILSSGWCFLVCHVVLR